MTIHNTREQALDSWPFRTGSAQDDLVDPDEQGDGSREAVLEAEVRRRVEAARAGNVSAEIQELLAEPDAPLDNDEDEDEDGDPAEVEGAWAEEIQRRVEEIRSGSVRTYALEDVLAAMDLRFG